MKIKFHYTVIIALLLASVGCKKDNYDAPSQKFSGRIVYNGEPINVEYNQVPFELYQPGFGKTGAITGTFDQDGNFSSLLFNGNYKFTIPPNQGPFRWKELSAGKRDTIAVEISGSKTMDIDVEPYYMLRNAQFNAAGGSLTATFNIEKVITDANAKNIDRVSLYINKTQFVSASDNVATKSIDGASITSLNNISMSVSIPGITPAQNYVFARVGIKINGVEDMIFSPLAKITF
ncbi:DUF3823 domain-containing protein [Mucilaginibacter litoreus]|uniref:DUF3823 domain-containing protein n=1 Tax=Mucilaginibacter litoreus TaxID=1048221 RepID=A0ABW3AW02_9SPHI